MQKIFSDKVDEAQLRNQKCPKCGVSEWFMPLDAMQFKEDVLAPPPKGNLRVATMMAVECVKCHEILRHSKEGTLEVFYS